MEPSPVPEQFAMSIVLIVLVFACALGLGAILVDLLERLETARVTNFEIDRLRSDRAEHAWDRGAVLYVSGQETGSGGLGLSAAIVFCTMWTGEEWEFFTWWPSPRDRVDFYEDGITPLRIESRRSPTRRFARKLLAALNAGNFVIYDKWKTQPKPPEELRDGENTHTNTRGAIGSRGGSRKAAEARAG